MRTGPDDFRGQPDSHLNHAPLPCLSPAGFDPKLSGSEAQWVLDPRQTGEGVIWPGQVERLSLPGEPLLPCRHDAPWSRTKPRAEAFACRCRHQTPVLASARSLLSPMPPSHFLRQLTGGRLGFKPRPAGRAPCPLLGHLATNPGSRCDVRGNSQCQTTQKILLSLFRQSPSFTMQNAE